MNNTCSVDGCTKALKTTKYCAMHYYRMSTHGSTDKPINAPMKWLLSSIETCSKESCLIWPFYKDKDGYASVTVRGKPKRAHRIVCEKVHGKPKAQADKCLHSCGNGHLGCVNPHHLYWGTQAENCADRIAHAIAAGRPASPRAILTKSQVKDIRSRLAGGETRKAIASNYGVTTSTIHDIAQGRSWQHLLDEFQPAGADHEAKNRQRA